MKFKEGWEGALCLGIYINMILVYFVLFLLSFPFQVKKL